MTEGLSEADRQRVDELVKELDELLARALKLLEKSRGEEIE